MPQGTVLGPILFSIYVNGPTKLLDEGEVVCYADDTVILIGRDSWVSKIAELAIAKVKGWLETNMEKPRFVIFFNA